MTDDDDDDDDGFIRRAGAETLPPEGHGAEDDVSVWLKHGESF